MKKKILRTIAVLMLIFVMITTFSSCTTTQKLPDAESASGKIEGTEIVWNYDKSSKVLEISGNGAIPNYDSADKVPWYSARHSVKEVKLGSGITEIGSRAFYYFPALESISIPATVTRLGDLALAFCSSLKSITLADGLTAIGASCFEGCSKLEGVFVPFSVKSIGERAFLSCGALKDVVIMAQITELKADTFKNCKSLATLCFNEVAKNITVSDSAFDGAAKNFGAAEFIASTTGAAKLTIKYVFEDNTEAFPTHTEELERGASYSVVSPTKEGYTASVLTVTGVADFNTEVTVTYKQNAVDAPEEETPDKDEEDKKDTSTGTIIAIVILLVVIAGVVVLAVVMMRSDKKVGVTGKKPTDNKNNKKK